MNAAACCRWNFTTAKPHKNCQIERKREITSDLKGREISSHIFFLLLSFSLNCHYWIVNEKKWYQFRAPFGLARPYINSHKERERDQSKQWILVRNSASAGSCRHSAVIINPRINIKFFIRLNAFPSAPRLTFWGGALLLGEQTLRKTSGLFLPHESHSICVSINHENFFSVLIGTLGWFIWAEIRCWNDLNDLTGIDPRTFDMSSLCRYSIGYLNSIG